MKSNLIIAGVLVVALYCNAAHANCSGFWPWPNPLKIGLVGTLESIDPIAAARFDPLQNQADWIVIRNVHASLLEYDERDGGGWDLRKSLVEATERRRDGEEEILSVTLKPNLDFTGGAPIDSKAAARLLDWSLSAMSDAPNGVIERLNGRTFEFRAANIPADFEDRFMTAPVGIVLPQDYSISLPNQLSQYLAPSADDQIGATAGTFRPRNEDWTNAIELKCRRSSKITFENVWFLFYRSLHDAYMSLRVGDIHVIGPIDAGRTHPNLRNEIRQNDNFALSLHRIAAQYVLQPRDRGRSRSGEERAAYRIVETAARSMQLDEGVAIYSERAIGPFPAVLLPQEREAFASRPRRELELKEAEDRVRKIGQEFGELSSRITIYVNPVDGHAQALGRALLLHLDKLGIVIDLDDDQERWTEGLRGTDPNPDGHSFILVRTSSQNASPTAFLQWHRFLAGGDSAEPGTLAGLASDILSRGALNLKDFTAFWNASAELKDGSLIPLFDVKVGYVHEPGLILDVQPDGSLSPVHLIEPRDGP